MQTDAVGGAADAEGPGTVTVWKTVVTTVWTGADAHDAGAEVAEGAADEVSADETGGCDDEG